MDTAHRNSTSESEEMYLITIARAIEAGRTAPVPVAEIAAELNVSVASANEMVRKLADRQLLAYEPYRGAALTREGEAVADRVLRIRRLWATFLAEHLGFSPSAADEQACDLEHVTTPEAAGRLAGFLGDPRVGPLGHSIPSAGTPAQPSREVPLSQIDPGEPAEVVAINATEPVRRFLAAEGVATGVELQVVARGAKGMLVSFPGGEVHLDLAAAGSVEVLPRWQPR